MTSTTPATPYPVDIKLHKRSGVLEITFSDGMHRRLSAELLRVHSPSAEVKGHGAGEGVLVTGKENVLIDRVDPVGRYAVKLVFDDGHDTGLYTWALLHELALDHERKWARYQARVAAKDGAAGV